MAKEEETEPNSIQFINGKLVVLEEETKHNSIQFINGMLGVFELKNKDLSTFNSYYSNGYKIMFMILDQNVNDINDYNETYNDTLGILREVQKKK